MRKRRKAASLGMTAASQAARGSGRLEPDPVCGGSVLRDGGRKELMASPSREPVPLGS